VAELGFDALLGTCIMYLLICSLFPIAYKGLRQGATIFQWTVSEEILPRITVGNKGKRMQEFGKTWNPSLSTVKKDIEDKIPAQKQTNPTLTNPKK
jgi:hypothetical protein